MISFCIQGQEDRAIPKAELQAMVDAADIPEDTPVKFEGSDDWEPVSAYIKKSPPQPEPIPEPEPQQLTPEQEAARARMIEAQKGMEKQGLALIFWACSLIVAFAIFSETCKSQSGIAERYGEIERPEFSEWNGSHHKSIKRIQSSMKDPSSFEHVDTTFNGEYVRTVYRGKNAFGAVVTQTATTLRSTGELVRID
jgi:hypothetical protein